MAGNPSKPRSPVVLLLKDKPGLTSAEVGEALFDHCLNPRQSAASALDRLFRSGKVERAPILNARGKTRRGAPQFAYFAAGEAPLPATDRLSQVLAFVEANPGCSPSDVGAALLPDVAQPAPSAGIYLTRLFRAGAVQRFADPSYPRLAYLYSPLGAALPTAAVEPIEAPAPPPRPTRPGQGAFISVAGSWGVSVSGGPVRG